MGKVGQPGELLQEFHVGHAELELKRSIVGLMMFEAQYQQHPIPAEGGVVKRAWMRYYDEPPAEIEFTLISWDTASTLDEDADWVGRHGMGCCRRRVLPARCDPRPVRGAWVAPSHRGPAPPVLGRQNFDRG